MYNSDYSSYVDEFSSSENYNMGRVSMNIRPLHDRVVVHRLEEKERTSAGGIVIPDSAAEKPSEGKIVAVGPGKFENGEIRPLSVKVGDRILFGKYAGTEVKISGKEYVVMREDDIMGVVIEE